MKNSRRQRLMAFHFGVGSTWVDKSSLLHPPPNSYTASFPNPASSPFQREPCSVPAYLNAPNELTMGNRILIPVFKIVVTTTAQLDSLPVWIWVLIDGFVSSCEWHGVLSPAYVSMTRRKCKSHSGGEEDESNNYNLLIWKAVSIVRKPTQPLSSCMT